MTFTPQASTAEIAQRVGASAHCCEVVSSVPLSPSVRELVLRGNAVGLAGRPGNDVMLRVGGGEDAYVRRRFSVRGVDAAEDTLTLWMTTEHEGPASRWAQDTIPGDHIDVIGPRGKIPLDLEVDWHLFVGDVSGLAAFYSLAQSIEAPGRAIFVVQIDEPADALVAPFRDGVEVSAVFVERREHARNDPAVLLHGLSAVALPPGEGHAYLFGEFAVMRALRDALVDRGMAPERVSHKAYWRLGRENAEHGEPERDD